MLNQTDNLSTPVVIFSPSSSSMGGYWCLGLPSCDKLWTILAERSEDLKGHVLDCQNRDIIINRQFY